MRYVILFLFLFPFSVIAQEESTREKKLEETVKLLEQRIKRLEILLISGKNASENINTAKTNEDINNRLAKIEKFMDEENQPKNMDVYWKDGIKFKSRDEKVKFSIGGRIYSDWSAGDIDEGTYDNGTTLRRVRFHLKGSYEDFFYKTQYDFAEAGLAEFKDVYMGYKGFDSFDVLVGQFKEPFSLAELTSSKYQSLMEDPTTAALSPGRNSGIQLSNTSDDGAFTWEAGIFHVADDFGNGLEDDEEAGDMALTGRLSYLLWNEDEGRNLLHIGGAYSYRKYDGDTIEIDGKGSYDTGDDLITSGAFSADTSQLFGLEAAWVQGPFSLQAEYVYNNMDSSAFHAYYVQASYFLTGEHRPYEEGQFKRVTPNQDFNLHGKGPGAVELAFRVGSLDLSDSPVAGSENQKLMDYTLGVNWHLTRNTRLMLNYVYTDSDSDVGDATAVLARFQIDF